MSRFALQGHQQGMHANTVLLDSLIEGGNRNEKLKTKRTKNKHMKHKRKTKNNKQETNAKQNKRRNTTQTKTKQTSLHRGSCRATTRLEAKTRQKKNIVKRSLTAEIKKSC